MDPTSELTPVLTIVIPAYNEANRLPRTLAAIRDYVAAAATPHELIVVDDGSADDTAGVVTAFIAATGGVPLTIKLLTNAPNRGKGFSVRRGMLAARGGLLLMCDADMSTPIEEVDRLRAVMARDAADIVIASRDMPDSRLSPPQPWIRRRLAALLRLLRRLVLLRRLRDTQCGFKLFSRAAARDAFARQATDGYAFDVEVLAIAERLGYRIREVGVTWRNDADSRVRVVHDGLRMLGSVVAIWWRTRQIPRPPPAP